jgi:hypothetical protein
MGKVNLMASSTLSDDDNCGHHVAFAPLSHGPSSSSSRAPSFWYSVAFAQSCRIVKCRHERPGSCGFHSLMTQADIRARQIHHPRSQLPGPPHPTDHRQLSDAEARTCWPTSPASHDGFGVMVPPVPGQVPIVSASGASLPGPVDCRPPAASR